jgi:hypothetical protein
MDVNVFSLVLMLFVGLAVGKRLKGKETKFQDDVVSISHKMDVFEI